MYTYIHTGWSDRLHHLKQLARLIRSGRGVRMRASQVMIVVNGGDIAYIFCLFVEEAVIKNNNFLMVVQLGPDGNKIGMITSGSPCILAYFI